MAINSSLTDHFLGKTDDEPNINRTLTEKHLGERQSITQKGVRAIDALNLQLEMAQVLQTPVFALPGCQRMSVNSRLCDTLGLAENWKTSRQLAEISQKFNRDLTGNKVRVNSLGRSA